MSDRTLSILLFLTTLIAILGYLLLPAGPHISDAPRFVKTGYMVFFGAVPILLMMKLISKIFPLSFKKERLSLSETMFQIFYLFLTREARNEWRGYINDQKSRTGANGRPQ